MISVQQIERLLAAGNHRLVIDRLLAGCFARGALAAEGLNACIHSPALAHVIATGLALQRICDLSYAPTPLADDLALQLRQRLDHSGMIDASGAQDVESAIAAAAIAIKALIRHNELTWTGNGNAPIDHDLNRGLNHLAQLCADVMNHDDSPPLISLVLWQLGDVAAFRQAAPIQQMIRFVRQAASVCDDAQTELPRLALAMAA